MSRKVSIPNRREVIVEAAERVFDRYSFMKSTMGDIAQETGLPRATLYQEFANKEDILLATIERKMGEIVSHMRQVAADSSMRPTQKLIEMLTFHCLTGYDKASRQCDPASIEHHRRRVQTELAGFYTTVQQLVAEQLELAANMGEIQPQSDYRHLAFLISQIQASFLPPNSLKFTRDELENNWRETLTCFLHGLTVKVPVKV